MEPPSSASFGSDICSLSDVKGRLEVCPFVTRNSCVEFDTIPGIPYSVLRTYSLVTVIASER